jgi:hypothetical protein
MKVHEFYGKYANVPLDKRFVVLDFNKLGTMNLHDIYQRINLYEETMRPMRIKEKELLEAVEKFLMKESL